MRKYDVRWWVNDPRERYEAALDAMDGTAGISVRAGSQPEGARQEIHCRWLPAVQNN